jgi:signal transduction histidine kinase
VAAAEAQAPPSGSAAERERGQAGRETSAGSGGVPVARSRRATAAVWFAVVLLSLAAAVLTVLAWGDLKTQDAVSNLWAPLAAVLYTTLGGLVVRRAGNVIGWMLAGIGAATAIMSFGSVYAVLGIRHPGTWPAPELVGLLAEWIFVPIFTGMSFMLMLFPTGRLPSPRWRPVAGLGLLATALTMVGFVVHPRMVALPAPGDGSLAFANPLGVRSLGPVLSHLLIGTLDGLSVLATVLLTVAFVSLVVRYRSSGREARQQIKWIALAAAAGAFCSIVALLAIAATGDASNPVTAAAYIAMPVIALFGIPAVITVAILKHGLYQIDVIINRALRYGLLSAALSAVYILIVVGIGTTAGYAGGPLLNAAAALAIAVLFQPILRRARLLANRIVYGQRATPYQVLADFAEDMAGQLDFTEAVERMVSVLAGATGADRAEAWIRVGPQLRPAAVWPPDSGPPPAVPLGPGGALPPLEDTSRAVAVRHSGELLGALSVRKPPNEPLTSADDKLLRHLASQAGLVLRNAQLTADLRATIEELRASRRRLVEAQDAERRKIERNLHDGAQQQLIALNIQLGLLEDAAGDPAAIRQLTPMLKDGLRAALDDLRDLARGIYPPLLADQGLLPALQAQARKAALPVEIHADGIGRYPQDTEATVYFCTLEALQNITKYAGASTATIGLSCSEGSLRFTVTDDGAGFDTASTRNGTGLQGMTDRLAALGGVLHVRSQPGHGTTLSGQLPASAPDQGGRGDAWRHRLEPVTAAQAARKVRGTGDWRVSPACAGRGRDPPKAAVTTVRAQRIRVAAVSGWSP